MNIKETLRSNKFKIAIGIVGALLAILLSFSCGIMVGFHKARFSYEWGQNYERNFVGHNLNRGNLPPPNEGGGMVGFFRQMEGSDLRNAHGLAGTVVSVSGSNIIVKDREDNENTVAVNDKTIIKRNADNLTISDIKVGDHIVVMGAPDNQGVVSADLIRLFGGSNNVNNEN
jgi:hypothetical protein